MGGSEGLNHRKRQVKAMVTRFWNFLHASEVDPLEVKARREKFEEMWSEYEQIQATIEMEDGVDLEAQNEYIAAFEDFKTAAMPERIISKKNGILENVGHSEQVVYKRETMSAFKLTPLLV